ncbi:perlucin-like [Argopecten irradians]|uniref:perlucin-like n=1 Tax=Argopecten irradians TaxID=31199 RepID=UPI00371ADB82
MTWPITLTILSLLVVNQVSTQSAGTCTHSFVSLDGSCYKGIKLSATWPDALAYCEVFGAELAIITSAEEQTAVQTYLATLRDPEYGDRDDHQYWFGANDVITEGDWKWAVTTKPVNYTNWSQGQPDNGGSDKDYDEEHCAEMSEERHWQWNDSGCEGKKHFLCEMISESE